MPARLGLGDRPSRRLLYLMALPAARARSTAAGAAALVVRDRVLEVGVPRVPRARRKGALVVAYLHKVTKLVVRLIRVPVITFERGDGFKFHGEVPAVGQSQRPGAIPTGKAGIAVAGKDPGRLAGRAGGRWAGGRRLAGQFRQGRDSRPVARPGQAAWPTGSRDRPAAARTRRRHHRKDCRPKDRRPRRRPDGHRPDRCCSDRRRPTLPCLVPCPLARRSRLPSPHPIRGRDRRRWQAGQRRCASAGIPVSRSR